MRLSTRYIPSSAAYFAVVAAVLAVFFQLWRLILLVAMRDVAVGVPSGVVWESFLVGLRFDFAVSCYITAPLVLLGAIPPYDVASNVRSRRINMTILSILAAIAFLVQLVDIPFFHFFNHRLNGMALQWTDTPGFVLGMIWESYPVVRWLLVYGAIVLLFIWTVRWIARLVVVGRPPPPRATQFVALPLLALLLLIGMRGRLEEKAPLRWGVAYFSTYDFANQLALNPNFTFFRDVVYNARSGRQVARSMQTLASNLTPNGLTVALGRSVEPPSASSRLHRRITYDPPADRRRSVILIIMESFGSSVIGRLDDRFGHRLTPRFDELSRQGTLFTNFHSNGMHTYTGLFSTLYGHPTIPGRSIMKRDPGSRSFWGLPSILQERGYEALFFTTHDPHFDNMQGFLKSNGIDRIYSLSSYDPSEKLSTLGVPDHVMFDRALTELRALDGSPFFAALLTSSNHGPWIVPDVPFDPLPETVTRHRQMNAVKYADWALGRFCERVFDDPRFDSTVIVITADNGMLFEPTLDFDLSQFRIPLLAIDRTRPDMRNTRSDRLGSQIDIQATVMGLLRLDHDDYSFGHDLLDSATVAADFALFSEGFRLGFIDGEQYVIWRQDAPSSLHLIGPNGTVSPHTTAPAATALRERALTIFHGAYVQAGHPLVPVDIRHADGTPDRAETVDEAMSPD